MWFLFERVASTAPASMTESTPTTPLLYRTRQAWSGKRLDLTLALTACFLVLLYVHLCYFISVRLGHQPAVLPKVSDLGACYPESVVFTVLLTLQAVLTSILGFRYLHQALPHIRHQRQRRLHVLSRFFLFMWVAGALVVAFVPSRVNDTVHTVTGYVTCSAMISVFAVVTVATPPTQPNVRRCRAAVLAVTVACLLLACFLRMLMPTDYLVDRVKLVSMCNATYTETQLQDRYGWDLNVGFAFLEWIVVDYAPAMFVLTMYKGFL